MDHAALLTGSEFYVRSLFASFTEKEYPYHNLKHTVQVVVHAREIARHSRLSKQDLWIVTVAAWFHDTGHLFVETEEHEEVGVLLMDNYLTDKGASRDLIAAIAGCIRATRVSGQPRDLNEKILCDADTYHFGTTYFRQTDPAIKQELEIRTGKTFPDWTKESIRLLRTHQFHTVYCRHLLNEGKRENIAWLEEQLQA